MTKQMELSLRYNSDPIRKVPQTGSGMRFFSSTAGPSSQAGGSSSQGVLHPNMKKCITQQYVAADEKAQLENDDFVAEPGSAAEGGSAAQQVEAVGGIPLNENGEIVAPKKVRTKKEELVNAKSWTSHYLKHQALDVLLDQKKGELLKAMMDGKYTASSAPIAKALKICKQDADIICVAFAFMFSKDFQQKEFTSEEQVKAAVQGYLMRMIPPGEDQEATVGEYMARIQHELDEAKIPRWKSTRGATVSGPVWGVLTKVFVHLVVQKDEEDNFTEAFWPEEVREILECMSGNPPTSSVETADKASTASKDPSAPKRARGEPKPKVKKPMDPETAQALKARKANMTPEEKKEAQKAKADRKAKKLAAMDPEDRAEYLTDKAKKQVEKNKKAAEKKKAEKKAAKEAKAQQEANEAQRKEDELARTRIDVQEARKQAEEAQKKAQQELEAKEAAMQDLLAQIAALQAQQTAAKKGRGQPKGKANKKQ